MRKEVVCKTSYQTFGELISEGKTTVYYQDKFTHELKDANKEDIILKEIKE